MQTNPFQNVTSASSYRKVRVRRLSSGVSLFEIREVVEMTADDIGKYTEGFGRTSLRYSCSVHQTALAQWGTWRSGGGDVGGGRGPVFNILDLPAISKSVVSRDLCNYLQQLLQTKPSFDFPQPSSSKQAAIATQPSNLPPKLPQYRNYELRIFRHDPQDHGSRVGQASRRAHEA
jgi:hypothetical protein